MWSVGCEECGKIRHTHVMTDESEHFGNCSNYTICDYLNRPLDCVLKFSDPTTVCAVATKSQHCVLNVDRLCVTCRRHTRFRAAGEETMDRLFHREAAVDIRALLYPEARSAGAPDCPSMI